METPKRCRPSKISTTPTTTPSTSKRQREEDEAPDKIIRRRRNVSLTLKQHVILIYHWFYKCSQKLAGYNAGLMDFSCQSSNHTVIDHYNFCRDVCRESMMENGEAIGGDSRIVEIKECAFGKRKYNGGFRRNTYWVFGGIERDSNNGFFLAVRKCSKRRLWLLIVKYIRPGTTIISHGWKSDYGLERINNYFIPVVEEESD